MGKKKDYVVLAVISDLTENQAAELSKEIMKAKMKNVPDGRGTIASMSREKIGKALQTENKKIGKGA